MSRRARNLPSRRRTRVGLLAAVWTAAALVSAGPASAQEALVTVGVDVTSASLTRADYTLLVVNHGPGVARGVRLTNTVPAQTTYLGADTSPTDPATCAAGAASGTECRWALGDIAPGASRSVAVSYAPAQAESAYTGTAHIFINSASAQVADAAPASTDPEDEDRSLVRTSHVLDQDAHADDQRTDVNFGACPELGVRGDASLTAFLDNDSAFPADDRVSTGAGAPRTEAMWAAEVRGVVKAVPFGTTPVIAVHRITSSDWDEGTGGCTGAAGSGHQVRGGVEPTAEGSSIASTPAATPGNVTWDVRGALDTRDERLAFQGFELRPGGAGGPFGATETVTFHSAEEAEPGDLRPRIVTMRTRVEGTRCVDADEETATGLSDRAHRVDAYVTETSLTTSPRAASADGAVDGCGGTPVGGAPIGWELDDDDPDAYIASLAGEAVAREADSSGGAGPDRGSTVAGPDGRSFIEIRLGEPFASGQNSGENRIAGIALQLDRAGGEAGAGGLPQGTCDPGEPMPISATHPAGTCTSSGESDDEDDVRMTWQPAKAPTGGGGGGGGEPASGGGSPPPPAPSQPGAVSRSVTLSGPASTPRVGQTITLAGRLTASGGCAGGEYVEILRRRAGARALASFGSVSTDGDGTFALPMRVEAGGEYVAVAPSREGCPEAASQTVSVLARGLVRAAVAGRSSAGTERPTRIYGTVVPGIGGTVLLERRVGRRWRVVARRAVTRRSTYAFPLRLPRSGRRTYRVRWRSPSRAYLGATSRSLSVRAPV